MNHFSLIRLKLGGSSTMEQAPAAARAPVDMATFDELGEKFERLITTRENLTSAITGAKVEAFKGMRKQAGSHVKLNESNEKITDIMELKRGEGENDENIEKNPSLVLREWLPKFKIKVLNVEGRNASKIPGLKKSVDDIISLVLNELILRGADKIQ